MIKWICSTVNFDQFLTVRDIHETDGYFNCRVNRVSSVQLMLIYLMMHSTAGGCARVIK